MKSAVYDLSRGKHWFDSRTEGFCDLTNLDEVIEELSGFLIAGLSAPMNAVETTGMSAKQNSRAGTRRVSR